MEQSETSNSIIKHIKNHLDKRDIEFIEKQLLKMDETQLKTITIIMIGLVNRTSKS